MYFIILDEVITEYFIDLLKFYKVRVSYEEVKVLFKIKFLWNSHSVPFFKLKNVTILNYINSHSPPPHTPKISHIAAICFHLEI